MSEEQQHQKEMLHAGEKAISAIQHAVISSAILRRPRVKIEIKTAEACLELCQRGHQEEDSR